MSGFLYSDLDDALRIGTSFDLVKREIKVASRSAYLYYIDEFTKDEIIEKLQEFFYSLKDEELDDNAENFATDSLPYLETDCSNNIDKIVTDVLSGVTALVINNYDKAILIDSRMYPGRNVEEPNKDKSLRGSRDGFVETITFNAGLIRRRIRTPLLTIKPLKMGKSSKTDIAICYIEGRADEKLIKLICDRVEQSKIDGLSMNQETFVNAIFSRKWYNPLPKFKFTERPDTASASILEGQICIIVDNSASAIIIPMTLFDITEEANDYYFPRITGAYLRISRAFITCISMVLTPLYLLAVMYPNLLPDALQFIAIKDPVYVPVFWQLIILELAIDGMKLAAVNTPNMLSTPLSVITALVIGDFAAGSGWFNSETMLYMAFVTIVNFTHESYELGYAIKFMRIFLLIMTAIFGFWGFVFGLVFVVVCLACSKSISGKGYLYPVIPLNIKELFRRITLK